MKTLRSILLIEDDQVDALTVKRAFKELNIENNLVVVSNGEQAFDYLKSNKNNPGYILLDLNMPRQNGIEFLKLIKKDIRLKKIPIIVLTTSTEESDLMECYNLSVAGYMIKPVNYKKFVEIINAINTYWNLSELPA